MRGIISFQGQGGAGPKIGWPPIEIKIDDPLRLGAKINILLWGLYQAAYIPNFQFPGLTQPQALEYLEATLGFFSSLGVGTADHVPTISIWTPPGVTLQNQIDFIIANLLTGMPAPYSPQFPYSCGLPLCAQSLQGININLMKEFLRSVEIANEATAHGWSLVNFMFPVPGSSGSDWGNVVRINVILTITYTYTSPFGGTETVRYNSFIKDYQTFDITRIVGDVSAITSFIKDQKKNNNWSYFPLDGYNVIVLVFNIALTNDQISQLKSKVPPVSNGLPVIVVDGNDTVTCVANCQGWTQKQLEDYVRSLGLIPPPLSSLEVPPPPVIEDPVIRFDK